MKGPNFVQGVGHTGSLIGWHSATARGKGESEIKKNKKNKRKNHLNGVAMQEAMLGAILLFLGGKQRRTYQPTTSVGKGRKIIVGV